MARLWRRKGTAAGCGCIVGEDRGVPSYPRLCSLFPDERESWLSVVICSGKGVGAAPGAGRTGEAARSARLTVKGGKLEASPWPYGRLWREGGSSVHCPSTQRGALTSCVLACEGM